jgi:aryl-alcohol dehydrogenase-like predicted oxidoreductase
MGDSPNEKGLSRKHIMHAIDASLTRLDMDYVDLYQIHRWDDETPIEETMEALHDVVKAGKARYIGASSMYAWQFAKAQYTAERNGWTRFISMQPMYNLVYREEEREMLPLCADQGVGVIPWSPLVRGVLAGSKPQGSQGETTRARADEMIGKWQLDQEANLPVLEAVQAVAKAYGVSPAQIALAWLLSKPVVTAPIVGASKLNHLDDAIAAADIKLNDDAIQRLDAPYTPHVIVGHR